MRSRDPEIRLRAVQRHPGEDAVALARVAREDVDPRVRREAIRRIEAPRALLELAEDAPDGDFARERAETLLARIAADRRDLEESRRALALLTPPPWIAEVAARAHFPELRIEALERLVRMPPEAPGRDQALARVAGKSRDPGIRQQALGALRSEESLALVASAPGAREAGPAAVRRIEDPDRLLEIANGKGAPAVRRLARRRAEARLPADHPIRIEERSQKIAALLGSGSGRDAAEALAREGAISEEAEQLLRAHREQAARPVRVRTHLEVEVPVVPPKTPPAAPAFPDVEPLLAELEEEAETLPFARIEAIERDVQRMMEGRRGAGRHWERFRAAATAARDAAGKRKRKRVVAFVFGDLAEQAEALSKSLETDPRAGGARDERELERIRTRYATFPEELQSGADGARIRAACDRAAKLLAAARKQLEDLEARLASLETADPFPIGEAVRALRDLAALRDDPIRWKRIEAERRKRFQKRRKALLPRIREARELQDWHRWSNLGSQEEIVRAAQGLLEVEDLAQASRDLVQLERSWRAVRQTDPKRGQELWEAWSAARETLLARVQPMRDAAAAEMETLTATAEEIAAAGDASRVAEMRDLAPAWRRASQTADRRQTRELVRRFRKANDSFFAAWKEARKEREAAYAAAIEIREALIGEAEALAETDDAQQSVRGLMARWKESPPVPRRLVEPLWERFREACDAARARPPETTDEPDISTAFADAVAQLETTPLETCVPAAAAIWQSYCRLEDAGEPGERLLARLAAAFEENPDAFVGTRFDQDALGERLEGIEAAIEERTPAETAPGEGAQAMAEHLSRVFARGGAQDREAEARDAARAAQRLLRRALAAGPALAPPAREALSRIRERVQALVAAAPQPDPEPTRRGEKRTKRRRKA